MVFYAIPIKIPVAFSAETDKLILEFIWKCKAPQIAKTISKNKTNALPNVKTYYKATAINTVWGFPGGAVVGSPPANVGDIGSSPGPRGSHVPQSSWARAPPLLGLCFGAREPQQLSPHATATEARAPRARAPQRERPLQ